MRSVSARRTTIPAWLPPNCRVPAVLPPRVVSHALVCQGLAASKGVGGATPVTCSRGVTSSKPSSPSSTTNRPENCERPARASRRRSSLRADCPGMICAGTTMSSARLAAGSGTGTPISAACASPIHCVVTIARGISSSGVCSITGHSMNVRHPIHPAMISARNRKGRPCKVMRQSLRQKGNDVPSCPSGRRCRAAAANTGPSRAAPRASQ